MPLSKKRNKDRMRESRLHKQLSPPAGANPVQPKTPDGASPVTSTAPATWVDADGNPVYND